MFHRNFSQVYHESRNSIPMHSIIKYFLTVPALLVCALSAFSQSSQPTSPLTNRELVALVYQLPEHPERRDEIVEEIRKRGIAFPLTDGMRSLVASKSGNDVLLRRTLEEAERRRVNPTASALPPEAEANDLLERARAATLAAAQSDARLHRQAIDQAFRGLRHHQQLAAPGQSDDRRRLPRQRGRAIQGAGD